MEIKNSIEHLNIFLVRFLVFNLFFQNEVRNK